MGKRYTVQIIKRLPIDPSQPATDGEITVDIRVTFPTHANIDDAHTLLGEGYVGATKKLAEVKAQLHDQPS